MTTLTVSPVEPYDFELCLRLTHSFTPAAPHDPSVLRTVIRVDNRPAVLELLSGDNELRNL